VASRDRGGEARDFNFVSDLNFGNHFYSSIDNLATVTKRSQEKRDLGFHGLTTSLRPQSQLKPGVAVPRGFRNIHSEVWARHVLANADAST
jgi:hypothetical protein